MKTWQYEIPAKLDGERIDLAIVAFDLGLSRRKIRAIIDAGGVYINQKRMRVASRPVRAGDKLRIEYNEESLRKIRQAEFSLDAAHIVYDENEVVAINKPPGLPSQATRDQSVQHVEPMLRKFLEQRHGKRLAPLILVHRLDKETSGLLLLARNNTIGTILTDLFRDRKVEKEYWALCAGISEQTEFSVKNFLAPIDKKGKVEAVRAGGKTAETSFQVLAHNKQHRVSLIKCMPKTGRSHQIRVHLADLGLPILGDKRYGDRLIALPPELSALTKEHHFLHARSLVLPLKDEQLQMTADLPENFTKALAWLAITGLT